MGTSLTPILRRELENLDKDADSKKSAMYALKNYVKDLDSKAIPVFLARVSETEQSISLYEVLARVHGPKIVPQIDNIMNSIVKTLSLSTGDFALHQACAKVVPAIARYAIDPTSLEDRKRSVIHSLCKPLSDCLLCTQENLSSGAALCSQALVETDNWRFSSSEMINEVCQRVAGALENHSQTNSHMALVMALSKHNSLIVEDYARLLIRFGLRILDDGFTEGNSEKELSAIQMVGSLMKYLDPRSLLSELETVMREMEKCQTDRMPLVAGAAFEALQIAKKICAEKEVCTSGEQSPYTASPELQTMDSFMGCGYYIESPKSTNLSLQSSDRRNMSRKHWRGENGIVDVSLKDGIFSNIITQGSNDILSSGYGDPSNKPGYYIDNFSGFSHGNVEDGAVGSNAPSPKWLNSRIKVDEANIFTTPRRLVRSLQDVDNSDSGFSKKQVIRFRSPIRSASMRRQNGQRRDSFFSGDEFQGSSESVSSENDVFRDEDPMLLAAEEAVLGHKSQPERAQFPALRNSACSIIYGLFAVLFAMLLCLLATSDRDDRKVLVPT